jgi:hypothetical protein
VLWQEHSLSSSATSEQLLHLFIGSAWQTAVGNQTLYIGGSNKRLYIEGADNGATQRERDCNNGTDITIKAERIM